MHAWLSSHDGTRLAVRRSGTLAPPRVFAARVARVPMPLLDARCNCGDDAVMDRTEVVGSLHDLGAMAGDSPEIAVGPDVTTATLLMQGAETWPPIPASMDALAAALPSATRTILPGQSDFATHTAPALFAAAVTENLHALTRGAKITDAPRLPPARDLQIRGSASLAPIPGPPRWPRKGGPSRVRRACLRPIESRSP
jgi:hypothetical protein